MPGLDGTGPQGQGPMTGGGFGRCNPTGAVRPYLGRGMRRGRRNRYYANAFDMPNADDVITQRNAELEAEIAASRQENRELSAKIDALSEMIEDIKAQTKPAKDK